MSEDGVAVFLFQNTHAGIKMHLHSKRLSNRLCLIDTARAGTPNVKLLESHYIRLVCSDHIRDAPGRKPPIRSKTAAHVIRQYARHTAPFPGSSLHRQVGYGTSALTVVTLQKRRVSLPPRRRNIVQFVEDVLERQDQRLAAK